MLSCYVVCTYSEAFQPNAFSLSGSPLPVIHAKVEVSTMPTACPSFDPSEAERETVRDCQLWCRLALGALVQIGHGWSIR